MTERHYKRYVLKEQSLPKTLVVFEMPRRMKGKGDRVLAVPYGKNGVEDRPQLISRSVLAASYDEVPDDLDASLSTLAHRNALGLPEKMPQRSNKGRQRQIDHAALAPKVLDLRSKGSTFANIGKKLGVSTATAHTIFRGNARPDMTGGIKPTTGPVYSRVLKPKLKAPVKQYRRAEIASADDLTHNSALWLGALIRNYDTPVRVLIAAVGKDPADHRNTITGTAYYQQMIKGGLVERHLKRAPIAGDRERAIYHYRATVKGNTVWSEWVRRQRDAEHREMANGGAEAQPVA